MSIPLRGQLADPAGGASVSVVGTISDPGDVHASGEFEFADNDSILQGVLEGKTFHLTADDGGEHDVMINSVNPGAQAGTSRAAFERA